MLTVEEALTAILSRVRPLGTERVELLAALGRVLAEPIVSRRVIPPWPNSSMDGYALRAEDTRADGAGLRVVGRVTAGSLPPRALGAGEAMRIFTGAPLPDGADAVVPQEDVTLEGECVRIPGRVARGTCVRPIGEDVRAGDLVLEPGRGLGAAEIGLLGTLGYARVAVGRRPRVAILSTGDELAELGKPVTFGSLGGRLVFGLPGNPVSAMVTFELFVRPAIMRLAGARSFERPRVRAHALAPIANPGTRRGYLRVTLHPDAGGWGARLTGGQGSAILRSMVAADGLAVVPGDTRVPAGGDLEVILLRPLPPGAR